MVSNLAIPAKYTRALSAIPLVARLLASAHFRARACILSESSKVETTHSLTFTRSHNRGRRPQARGPRKTIEKDKCAIFSENCATLNVINSRGYTQICVGLGDSPQARFEARLEGLTHAIEKSFNYTSNKILASKSTVLTLGKRQLKQIITELYLAFLLTPGNWKQFQKIGPRKFYQQET